MIIFFKFKFIFIKTYQTTKSSIEKYLYLYLNNKNIFAPIKNHDGINCWGTLKLEIKDYFSKQFLEKKIQI